MNYKLQQHIFLFTTRYSNKESKYNTRSKSDDINFIGILSWAAVFLNCEINFFHYISMLPSVITFPNE